MYYDEDILEAVQILKVLDSCETEDERVKALIDILEEIKQEHRDLWADAVKC